MDISCPAFYRKVHRVIVTPRHLLASALLLSDLLLHSFRFLLASKNQFLFCKKLFKFFTSNFSVPVPILVRYYREVSGILVTKNFRGPSTHFLGLGVWSFWSPWTRKFDYNFHSKYCLGSKIWALGNFSGDRAFGSAFLFPACYLFYSDRLRARARKKALPLRWNNFSPENFFSLKNFHERYPVGHPRELFRTSQSPQIVTARTGWLAGCSVHQLIITLNRVVTSKL